MDNQEKADVDLGGTPSRNNKTEALPSGNGTAKEGGKAVNEYVTGLKLWLVIASVTLVLFLTLLDTTIIVTVWFNISVEHLYMSSLTGMCRLFLESPPTSIRCLMSDGTVVHTS